QAPVLVHRQPELVQLFERQVQRADGALEQRREGEVESPVPGKEQSPGGTRLVDPLRRQIHVGPAGEAVFAVPAGFAVPQQHELVHALNYNAARQQGRRMEFITKNIFLIVIAAVSGGMLLWPLLRKGTGGPWVNTLQATQLMNRDDALVVDLRPADEFAKGHIL